MDGVLKIYNYFRYLFNLKTLEVINILLWNFTVSINIFVNSEFKENWPKHFYWIASNFDFQYLSLWLFDHFLSNVVFHFFFLSVFFSPLVLFSPASSPLFPLPPSQINEAYNRRTKNSNATVSVHFFFLSFSSFLFLMFLFFSFLYLPKERNELRQEGLSAHLSAGSPCAALYAIMANRLRLWDQGPRTRPLAVCHDSYFIATGLWRTGETNDKSMSLDSCRLHVHHLHAM